MKTVPIDKFAPQIAPYAENVPVFVVRSCVAATVQDICSQTGCVTTDAWFTVVPGKREYVLELPEGIDSEVVRHLFIDGDELKSARNDDLAKYYYGKDWTMSVGTPMFYTFEKPDQLLLTPTPNKPGRAHVMMTASVVRDTKHIPQIFFDEYLDTVVAGALERIFRIAGQTFSNRGQADYYGAKYIAGLNAIKADTDRDFTRSNGRVFFNRIV